MISRSFLLEPYFHKLTKTEAINTVAGRDEDERESVFGVKFRVEDPARENPAIVPHGAFEDVESLIFGTIDFMMRERAFDMDSVLVNQSTKELFRHVKENGHTSPSGKIWTIEICIMAKVDDIEEFYDGLE